MNDFIAWHGTSRKDMDGFSFQGQADFPEGIHLGSFEKARMRSTRAGHMIKVQVLASRLSSKISRTKDRDGYWRDTATRLRRQGKEIVVYLNRHEGLSHADLEALLSYDNDHLAKMSDRAFRSIASSATDSWMVLHDDMVKILEIIPTEDADRLAAAQRLA